MVCDLGQRHFEKIEAAVQISYGVSFAHRSKNRRHLQSICAPGDVVAIGEIDEPS
jgi:hypothetical protein